MLDLFGDIDLNTELVNDAYKTVNDLLNSLFIEDADSYDKLMEGMKHEMSIHNPFDYLYPTRETIRNLFEATSNVIKSFYPNAIVTYKAYPHTPQAFDIIKDFDIEVDDDTYRSAFRRGNEIYELGDEDEYLRKYYGIGPKKVEKDS